jgi:ATP/maltotriose-dependent transcriptional regulator MalT
VVGLSRQDAGFGWADGVLARTVAGLLAEVRAVDSTCAGLVPREGAGLRDPLTVAPVAPRLIDRGDLVAALDRAAARKVTVISAPAGSGKTSLLRAWAGRPGQPGRLAVLQVQRDQHDAQQVWLALLDAVRHATGADSGAELPAATPDFNAPAMADRVISELADAPSSVTLGY